MKKKTAFWDKPNPKKKSTPLTPEQKKQAKARAKAAGRPYPNLVDNAAVKRTKKKQETQVALGQYGTTLLDELNRLANGGTYRAPAAMVGEALAAKQWATQRSVSTNLTDTVGVLNAIAGTSTTNRLDYNGVCNLIAGTFQLPAAQALRAVSS